MQMNMPLKRHIIMQIPRLIHMLLMRKMKHSSLFDSLRRRSMLSALLISAGSIVAANIAPSLPLSHARPRAAVTENFEYVDTNRPIHADGWLNLAARGSRNWWGYTLYNFEADNHVAKITAYGLDEDAKSPDIDAWLISPPLAYDKATDKILSFRIMGLDMRSDMGERLEVCYIEDSKTGTTVIPLDLDIDYSAEHNDKWQQVTADLSQAGASGVFYIGFRLAGTSDSDYTGVYFIDDFSWGKPVETAGGEVVAVSDLHHRSGFDTPEILLADDHLPPLR